MKNFALYFYLFFLGVFIYTFIYFGFSNVFKNIMGIVKGCISGEGYEGAIAMLIWSFGRKFLLYGYLFLDTRFFGWIILLACVTGSSLCLCFRCGNINWAKRTKCNICNTNKPGHNEGGVRYKVNNFFFWKAHDLIFWWRCLHFVFCVSVCFSLMWQPSLGKYATFYLIKMCFRLSIKLTWIWLLRLASHVNQLSLKEIYNVFAVLWALTFLFI